MTDRGESESGLGDGDDGTPSSIFNSPARMGILLLVAGLIGLAAALALGIEKFRILENPLYVPPCTVNEVLDCGSVMRSGQSQAFGFPNPFVGIAGFAALTATGFVLFTGGRLTRPYWAMLQVGLTFAVIFVHWLIFQTLYSIGALCPFCMAVWAVTIPAFWYVTLCNLQPVADGGGGGSKFAATLIRNHGIILTSWMLLIAVLVAERFWSPWNSVFA